MWGAPLPVAVFGKLGSSRRSRRSAERWCAAAAVVSAAPRPGAPTVRCAEAAAATTTGDELTRPGEDVTASVARGEEEVGTRGATLAAAPPTTATVDAAATALLIDTAVAVVPFPSDVLSRCGNASIVIHSARGRRPV